MRYALPDKINEIDILFANTDVDKRAVFLQYQL